MMGVNRYGYVIVVLILVVQGAATGIKTAAAPLNLLLQDSPDIFSSLIEVGYDADTDAFSASGNATSIDDDGVGPQIDIDNGEFEVEAEIDSTGSLVSGTVVIDGTVPSLGYNSGSILMGTLALFGFRSEGGDPLEFGFEVTGGDAATLFGGTGAMAGIILGGGTGFPGVFSADFSGTGSATSDTRPVIPEPVTVVLLYMATPALLVLRRSRKRL